MLVHWKALMMLYIFPTNLLTTILVSFVQAAVFDTWMKSTLVSCAVRLANSIPRGGGDIAFVGVSNISTCGTVEQGPAYFAVLYILYMLTMITIIIVNMYNI